MHVKKQAAISEEAFPPLCERRGNVSSKNISNSPEFVNNYTGNNS